MPHCKSDVKRFIDLGTPAANAAELNYAITRLLREYWLDNRDAGYQALNDCMGALEGAKHEFYRVIAVPYEDDAIQRNGNAYD